MYEFFACLISLNPHIARLRKLNSDEDENITFERYNRKSGCMTQITESTMVHSNDVCGKMYLEDVLTLPTY